MANIFARTDSWAPTDIELTWRILNLRSKNKIISVTENCPGLVAANMSSSTAPCSTDCLLFEIMWLVIFVEEIFVPPSRLVWPRRLSRFLSSGDQRLNGTSNAVPLTQLHIVTRCKGRMQVGGQNCAEPTLDRLPRLYHTNPPWSTTKSLQRCHSAERSLFHVQLNG